MVPDLIWAPDLFGPQEILSPRNFVPKKFGPREISSLHENHYIAFSCRDQLSWGPKFSGPKFLRDQKSQGPKWGWGPFQLYQSEESEEWGCLCWFILEFGLLCWNIQIKPNDLSRKNLDVQIFWMAIKEYCVCLLQKERSSSYMEKRGQIRPGVVQKWRHHLLRGKGSKIQYHLMIHSKGSSYIVFQS